MNRSILYWLVALVSLTTAQAQTPHKLSATAVSDIQLIRAAYQHADKLELAGYLKALSPTVKFRFANAPQTTGQAPVQAELSGLFGTLKRMHHEILHLVPIDQMPGWYMLRADVSYFTKKGKTFTFPCVTLIEMKDKKTTEVQIFIDISPMEQYTAH